MADILIRGMEMPECCGDCQFQTSRWTGDFCSAGQIMFGIDFDYRDKHPKCPLVPIPEGHGRLGDLDKINASLGAMIEIEDNQNDAPYSWAHAYTEMQSILDEATTIVPAEGGGEDG